MTAKHKNRQFKNHFSFIFELLKESKLKLIILAALTIIALLTGIIVACKTGRGYEDIDKFDLLNFGFGFWGRLFSMLLVALICFGCSFCPFLFPIALIFLAYRGFLLGLDLTLIIICNTFSGIVVSILVILPCQLIALAVMVLMYVLLCKTQKDFKCFGGGKVVHQRLKVLLLALGVLIAVCLVESLLFTLLSPNVILIV